MSRFVLDCSVVLAWCFEDEGGRYAERVLESLTEDEAVVPAIWPLEVANALLVAERRKRIKQADSVRFVSLLRNLPIEIDGETATRAMGDTMAIARREMLSAYDAAYLELSMRCGAPLATLDKAMKKAMKRLGATLFG